MITLEFDAYDAEAYNVTMGELLLNLNNQYLTDIPYGYLNSKTPGSLAPCPTGQVCSAGGYGSKWQHISLDISDLVITGSNNLTFVEQNGHSCGIANITVKQNGTTIFGPAQVAGYSATCLTGITSGASCACNDCNNLFSGGSPSTVSFTFNAVAQPRVSISATPIAPLVGQPVNFAASAAGGTPPFTSFAWNFGDATTGTGQSTSHSYTVAGSYHVTVTVTDSSGQTAQAAYSVSVGASHTLSLGSSPTPISFTINGQGATTPFSQALVAGSYTVIFPTSVQIGGVTYTFSNWDDGSIQATRVINLTADTSLSVIYTGVGLNNVLTVNSTPTGITFALNGANHTTPYSQSLPQAIYTVTVPATQAISGITYTFHQWSDGSTSLTRIVTLATDISLSTTYTSSGGPPPPPPVNELALVAIIGGVALFGGIGVYFATRKKGRGGGGAKRPSAGPR